VNFKQETIMTVTEDPGAQGVADFPSTLRAARFLIGATIAALLAIIASFLPGVPAAHAQTPGSTRLENIVTYNGVVNHRWSDDNGASWSAWNSLGAPNGLPLAGTPAAVSDGAEHIYVMAVAPIPGSNLYSGVWYNTAYSHGASWNGWALVPGQNTPLICTNPPNNCFAPISSPSLSSWGAGRVDLFVTGLGDNSQGQIIHTWADNDLWSGTWDALGAPGAGLMPNEAPAAISWAPGRIDLFVRGRDNALYHKWFDNGWSADWQYLGGILTSPPVAASYWGFTGDVFVRGTDGHLYDNQVNSNVWTGWADVGCCLSGDDNVVNAVAATSLASGSLDVFVIGTDHTLWRKTNTRSVGWSPWQLVDGSDYYTNIAVVGWVPIAPPPPSGGGGGGGSGGGGGGGGGCRRPCTLPP
jgi:hypothetical protein